MAESERVLGKVARINSDRELIINRGANHGVEAGMTFVVKGDPIDIKDPDSGDSLGQVAVIKVIVRVEEVDEKFSIARTFRTHRALVEGGQKAGDLYTSYSAVGSSLNRLLQPPRAAKYETRVETLRVDPDKGKPISERDSVVSVGDIVESVLENEDLDPATTTLFR